MGQEAVHLRITPDQNGQEQSQLFVHIASVSGQKRQAWREEPMKRRRRRVKQIYPLEERLAEEAKELRERAKALPPGPEREVLLRRARHDEAAAHMTEWLMSRP